MLIIINWDYNIAYMDFLNQILNIRQVNDHTTPNVDNTHITVNAVILPDLITITEVAVPSLGIPAI